MNKNVNVPLPVSRPRTLFAPFRVVRRAGLALVVFLTVALHSARGEGNYSLEYSVISASGSFARAPGYTAVSLVEITGVQTTLLTSSNYSISSVVGVLGADTWQGDLWMIY